MQGVMTNYSKVSKMFIILYSFIHAIVVLSQGPQPVDTWFRNLKNQKNTVIEVYVHEFLGGPGQTVYEIARASITSTSPTSFGRLLMVDDLLTAGPDPNSREVGRLQGLVGFADLNVSALYISVNFLFTGGGSYNGSTISVMGTNHLLNNARELCIVGGTGVFRLARGTVVLTIYMNFNATGYAIFKYTFYVTY